MFRAGSAELGNSKPIGCMRGSAWQNQPKRRTLPYFPDETLAQSNDANQCLLSWVIGEDPSWSGPFYPSPYAGHEQEEAVCFSADLIRGAAMQQGVLEADVLGFDRMIPGITEEGIKAEMVARAGRCYERDVSFMFTHWVYQSTSPNLTGLNLWQSTISGSIVPLLNEESRPTLTPIPAAPFLVNETNLNNYNYVGDAVDYWRTAGGALDASVPLALAYALA